VSGRYLFTANFNDTAISIVDIGGVEAASLLAHSAEVGTLSVRESAHVSDQFTVDHTPPKLELKLTPPSAADSGRLKAEVTAVDAVGTIARAEISIMTAAEAGAAVNVLPCRDGICDTSSEGFLIDLPDPGPGHQVTVRVFDAAGNSATVEIPGRSG